jgi:hypothetical protein
LQIDNFDFRFDGQNCRIENFLVKSRNCQNENQNCKLFFSVYLLKNNYLLDVGKSHQYAFPHILLASRLRRHNLLYLRDHKHDQFDEIVLRPGLLKFLIKILSILK